MFELIKPQIKFEMVHKNHAQNKFKKKLNFRINDRMSMHVKPSTGVFEILVQE